MNVIIFNLAPSTDYPDGGVSITQPSYGDRLRPEGDTDDALLSRVIARAVLGRLDSEGNGVCQDGVYHVIDDADIPAGRTFRDAWAISGGRVVVDMGKARIIHMDAIRVIRDAQLASLDIPWMKAVEAGNTSAQATIATEKQVLRDIPTTFDLTTGIDTPEQLTAAWPEGLPRG